MWRRRIDVDICFGKTRRFWFMHRLLVNIRYVDTVSFPCSLKWCGPCGGYLCLIV
jgi:hypothetical protein